MTEHDDDDIDDAILEAEAALQRGEPEAALTAAAGSKHPGYRAAIESRAYLELGMLDAASGAIDRAREGLGDEHPDAIELAGELSLAQWRIEDAKSAFEAMAADDDTDPFYLERLALIADLGGDHDAAHELMQRAAALDDERPAPIRMTDDAFAEVVDGALAALPQEFASSLEVVRVVTEPMPFREVIDPSNVGATPPDLLGLFFGTTIHELAEDSSAELPPTIYLFQRNLERMVGTEDELRDEIRVTLFHEFGHLLGLDEEEVAGMGLA